MDDDGTSAWIYSSHLVKEAGLSLNRVSRGETDVGGSARCVYRCATCPVLDLLEQAAAHFDLIASLDGAVVRLEARQEVPQERLAVADRALTARLLRAALAADENHIWAPAATLELGNLEASQGHAVEAGKHYDWVIREAQTSGMWPRPTTIWPGCNWPP